MIRSREECPLSPLQSLFSEVAWAVSDVYVDTFDEHVIESPLIVRIGDLARSSSRVVCVLLRGHVGWSYVLQNCCIILRDRLLSYKFFNR